MTGTRMKSKTLARAGGSKSVTLERTGEEGNLRMSLQVHADPQGYRTRVGYYADLFLKLAGPIQEGDYSREERHIGFISSWRLSKEPNQYGHENYQPWVTEWLRSELGDKDDDSRPFKETLRLLYDDTGRIRGNINDELIRSALDETGNELVFVEMLWIKYKDDTTGMQYSRQRIAPHALELFYSLLNNGTLPAWYTINLPITFIARAGMPSDDGLSEMWLNEHPRNSGQTEKDYRARISDHIEAFLQIVQRYGYRKISNDHRVVVLTVSLPQRLRVVNSTLEDETARPQLGPKQIKPQAVLSSIR
ncbi:hypothetical protein KVR01_001115 [Diaporthe batatas]|uniref:uncharacterized protein n=1 Tax=Diaporthe batatas TaxID=748121 RepID=UPI001D05A83D|nr:uncharacterized protein KVR01_001115 [Diaporthe batatas]KAG8168366.1 hypothetical protein KVR01_001115 [Diaporthe batatas]